MGRRPPRSHRTDPPFPSTTLFRSRVHRQLTAGRTVRREYEGYGVFRPALHHHTDDLRDHIAGALHDHRIADAHVLAGDLILVLQGGVGDQHTADIDRLQLEIGRAHV